MLRTCPVAAGPVEATVIGNVLVQGIAAGRFSSLTEGRQYVASKVKARRFTPCVCDALVEARNRYAQLEERCADALTATEPSAVAPGQSPVRAR